MNETILRFNGAVPHDSAIDAWFQQKSGPLSSIAKRWFDLMRQCGDEVREILHDGCPTACLGDAPFAYVGVYKSHVNVGFFHGALLRDPARLLQGSGKRMRHVKLSLDTPDDTPALARLIADAWSDIQSRVEND